MQYELNVEEVSQVRRTLSFTVPDSIVNKELDKAFRTMRRDARLPGFRKGKVPLRLLEARFGRQVSDDVASELIDQSWRQAMGEFEVAGRPALEERGELKRGTSFSFKVGVDVVPTIEAQGYAGLEVPFSAESVSDEQVESALQRRLQGQARFAEVSDRAVETGDHVLAEVKLVDGEEVVLDEPGTLITVGNERFYPGIDELLVGLEIGGSKEGEATIGEGSLREDLQGRSGVATVKVVAIQARVVPELDDKVAKDMGFEGGAESVRPAIRMELESAAQDAGRNDARVKLLQKLVEMHDFDVPEAMVAEQFEALQEEMKVRRTYAGADPRSIQFSEAELADLRSRARFAAKASVLLVAVARQESLVVSDDDMAAKIEEIASMRNQTAAAIRGYLEREGAMPTLKDRILEEKVLEWLLENAELVAPAVEEAPVAQEAAEAAGEE